MNSVEKVLPEISTTKSVHINRTDVTDPRTTVPTRKTEATEKTTTEAATDYEPEITLPAKNEYSSAAYSYSATEPQSSTAVSVAAAQSFIRPHDGEIIKGYSPDVPVYCETMNDWRTFLLQDYPQLQFLFLL